VASILSLTSKIVSVIGKTSSVAKAVVSSASSQSKTSTNTSSGSQSKTSSSTSSGSQSKTSSSTSSGSQSKTSSSTSSGSQSKSAPVYYSSPAPVNTVASPTPVSNPKQSYDSLTIKPNPVSVVTYTPPKVIAVAPQAPVQTATKAALQKIETTNNALAKTISTVLSSVSSAKNVVQAVKSYQQTGILELQSKEQETPKTLVKQVESVQSKVEKEADATPTASLDYAMEKAREKSQATADKTLENFLNSIMKKHNDSSNDTKLLQEQTERVHEIIKKQSEKRMENARKDIETHGIREKFDPSYMYDQLHFDGSTPYFTYGDGNACKAMAYATMASINTGVQYLPTEVGADEGTGILTSAYEEFVGTNGDIYVQGHYDTDKNANATKEKQLQAIKDELKAGRSIAVEVDNGNSQHWVVITGTVDGVEIDDIKSLSDLKGVDPAGFYDDFYRDFTTDKDYNGLGFNDTFYGYMTIVPKEETE
jgi:hypothetical protein